MPPANTKGEPKLADTKAIASGDGPHRDPDEPAAHVSNYLALLPSGPDAVRRLKLHRIRAAVRPITTRGESSVYPAVERRGKAPPTQVGGLMLS